jgi:hypothetical protein
MSDLPAVNPSITCSTLGSTPHSPLGSNGPGQWYLWEIKRVRARACMGVRGGGGGKGGGGTCAVTKMSTATPAGRAHQLQSTHRAKSHFPWCGIQRGALTLYYTGDARETSEESKASDEGGESEESTEISEPRAGSGESTEISETEGQTCLRRIPFPHRERQGVVIRTTACQNNP